MDPRYFAPFDAGEIIERGQRMQMNKMRVDEYRAEQDKQRRLGDLVPRAVNGDKAALAEIPGLDLGVWMKLDEHQKAQAQAEVADLTQAVRWADNPEKWALVQQHFGTKGVDLSQYGFERREEGMLHLGKLGEYMKSAPEEKIIATQPGGGAIAYDPTTRGTRVLIQPNDGSAPMGAPSQGGGVREGATATNPQTGEKIVFRNGQWTPANGGSTPQASSNFPSRGPYD